LTKLKFRQTSLDGLNIASASSRFDLPGILVLYVVSTFFSVVNMYDADSFGMGTPFENALKPAAVGIEPDGGGRGPSPPCS
ncbi:MAG: hypothetical protein VX612_09005, partial [Pseudomonadota bacterium]|nr:hypothetical protein [Pseudomonadota bacterium]